jgi:hypothetical protein
MESWFDEKTHQLNTDTVTAFGIRLYSRYAKAREMIEMIAFAQAATNANVDQFVSSLFYDSKAGLCNFTLSPSLEHAGEPAKQALLAAAIETITQFVWEGGIHHGRPLQSETD